MTLKRAMGKDCQLPGLFDAQPSPTGGRLEQRMFSLIKVTGKIKGNCFQLLHIQAEVGWGQEKICAHPLPSQKFSFNEKI